MSLPKAVQAQVDEANRIQAQMYAPQDEVEAQDPPAEEAQLELPLDEPQQPKATDWEHKYKSEIGRFQAETNKAREAANSAWEQVNQLRLELDQLKAAPKDEPKPEPELPGVTDHDVETFGAELVEFAQRAANKAAADNAKVLRAEIQGIYKAFEELRGQLGTTETKVQQSAEQTYYARLADIVPNWEQVNQDPEFLEWLQQEEGVSGYPRQAFLAQAHQALDAQRVAKFFQAFRGESPVPASKPSPSDELQKQVSPPKSRSSTAQPQGKSTKIWTQTEIAQFYQAKALGKINPEQAARMEADLNSAVAEGRVR